MTTTSRGQALNVWMVIFTILILSTFVGRFATYYMMRRKLRRDDLWIVLAFLCLLAMQITTWMTIPKNLGAHYVELTAEEASWQHRIQFSSGITWTLATVFCKVAVLDMYLHIFPPSRVQYAIYGTMGCSVAFAIVFIPLFITACDPPSAAWNLDPMVAFAHCRPIQRQEFASVAVNMALDLLVVIIPLPSVWELKMPVDKKIKVSMMFSLGLAVVGVSAWRIFTTVESTKTMDWSYILLTIALQSHLELWLGILAANLPMMNYLFAKVFSPAVTSIKSWVSRSFNSSQVSSSNNERLDSSAFLRTVRKGLSPVSQSNRSMEIPMIGMDDNGTRRDFVVDIESDQAHQNSV